MEEKDANPNQWTTQQVKQWIIDNGFSKFVDNFEYSDGKRLLSFTYEDLIRLNIPNNVAVPLAKSIEALNNPPKPQDPLNAFQNPEEKYNYILGLINKVDIGLPSDLVDKKRQANLLGPFNRPDVSLPFCEQSIDMRLLGLLKKDPTPAALSVIEALDNLKGSGTFHCAFVGKSGCTKTRSIFDIANNHFVMYIECVAPGHEPIDPTLDRNFIGMVEDLGDCHSDEPIEAFQERVKQRIRVELLARLLYLRGLFKVKSDITPIDYLLGQINGGQKTIGIFVAYLRGISLINLGDLLKFLLDDLAHYLKRHRLIVAIDEANVGMRNILYGRFHSPRRNERGLLTPLIQAVVNTGVSSLCAGTTFTMLEADSIQSDIGKENRLVRFTNFESTKEGEPQTILSREIDVSGCEDVWMTPPGPETHHELVGRKRLLAGVINALATMDFTLYQSVESPKALMLYDAIASSVRSHHDKMTKVLRRAVQSDLDLINLLRRIVVANSLMGGRINFPINEKKDLVHIGICQLVVERGNKYQWKLSEPLAIRVINEVLLEKEAPEESVLVEARIALSRVLSEQGTKSKAKGEYGEVLIAAEMFQPSWQGKIWAELPVIRGKANKNLPPWMYQLRFSLKRYGTAKMLGLEDDIDYIQKCALDEMEDVLLFPNNLMGPDGIMLVKRFVDKSNNAKLLHWTELENGKVYEVRWFAIVLSSKIYSGKVPTDVFKRGISSTDLTKVYFTKDGAKPNPKAENVLKQFHAILDGTWSSNPELCGGVLRIHVSLPQVPNSESIEQPVTIDHNDKNVIVHITNDKSNVGTLFSKDSIEVLEYATGHSLK